MTNDLQRAKEKPVSAGSAKQVWLLATLLVVAGVMLVPAAAEAKRGRSSNADGPSIGHGRAGGNDGRGYGPTGDGPKAYGPQLAGTGKPGWGPDGRRGSRDVQTAGDRRKRLRGQNSEPGSPKTPRPKPRPISHPDIANKPKPKTDTASGPNKRLINPNAGTNGAPRPDRGEDPRSPASLPDPKAGPEVIPAPKSAGAGPPSFAPPRTPVDGVTPAGDGDRPAAQARTSKDAVEITAKPDEVLVLVAFDATDAATDAIAARWSLEIVDRWPMPEIDKRCVQFRIRDGRDIETVLAGLKSEAVISGPQRNFVYRAQQQRGREGGEGKGGLQYALGKVGLAPSDPHAVSTGRGVVVGIIDTGVDVSHEDLRNSDIVTFEPGGSVGSSLAPDAHGTAIAGIIAARGTTLGVAPGVRLAAARAFEPTASGAIESTTVKLLKSLSWLMTQGVDVVNLSFAGPEDPLLREFIAALTARGVIVVAAAGNNGHVAPPAYPAAYDNVIAVTATDIDDRLYDQANVGPYVDIAAPGVDIFAATPGQTHELQSGTSFAAAHITGIVALILEQHPKLPAAEIFAALASGALDLGPPGVDPEFGAGLADARSALRVAAPGLR